VSTAETCRAAYRNVIDRIELHLVGQLLHLIHDAQTHEFEKNKLKIKKIQMLVKPSVSGHNVCQHKTFTDSVTAGASGRAGQAITFQYQYY